MVILLGVGSVVVQPFAMLVLAVSADDCLALGRGQELDELDRQGLGRSGPGGHGQGVVGVDDERVAREKYLEVA